MQYDAVNAKIKAMQLHLFNSQDYEELSKSKDVHDLGLKLKDTPEYARVLYDLEEKNLTRGNIEPKLTISLVHEFLKIYRFIGDFHIKKYLNSFILEKEIYILKLILAIVYSERSIAYSLPELDALQATNLSVDFSKLSTSKNISEFMDNLKGSRFHYLLNAAYENGDNLFEMETRLDIYYHLELWKIQGRYLKGDDLRVMQKINGCDIDLKNLMWMYKLKRFYNLEESKIYSYLIPIYHNLKKSEIEKIVQTKNIAELETEIFNTKYGEQLLVDDKIEYNYNKILQSKYKKTKIRYRNSIATIAEFIFYKNIEIYNVTSLLEGVRYGLSPELIQMQIIRHKD